jgi:hypothetical protein
MKDKYDFSKAERGRFYQRSGQRAFEEGHRTHRSRAVGFATGMRHNTIGVFIAATLAAALNMVGADGAPSCASKFEQAAPGNAIAIW